MVRRIIAFFVVLLFAVPASGQYNQKGTGLYIQSGPGLYTRLPSKIGAPTIPVIPARVQGTYSSSTGATPALSYTSNVTLNNLLLVVAICENAVVPTGATDTIGNTYALLCGGGGYGSCAYVYYAISKASGANTITVNWGSGSTYTAIIIREWSGVNTTDPFDGGAALNQQNATPGIATSGSFTPNVNGDLIYALTVATHGSMSISAGPGFTVSQGPLTLWGSANQALDEYMVQPIAGSTAGTFTTATDQGGMYQLTLALAFRPAGSTRNVTPTATTFFVAGAVGSGTSSITSYGFQSYQPQLGEIICVAVTWAGQSLTPVSLSDGNLANVYTPIFSSPILMPDGITVGQVWYAVILGNCGNLTLTLSGNTISGSTDGILMDIWSARGASITSPIDIASKNSTTGNGASFSITSGTPAHTNELFFSAFLLASSGTPFSGNSWAELGYDAVSFVSYLNSSDTTQKTSTVTAQASSPWAALIFGLLPMSN